MHVLESEQVESVLKRMWAEHREYLKRMLISLTRDIDLTDDLLQETYLRAHNGVSAYRGGDARAWLAVIAKNVFYAHARKRYVRSEVPLDARPDGTDHSRLDSLGHLTLLEVRRAIDSLAPPLRTAVIMKHYGGFTYKEIAKRLGCPAGTAQRRVWTAMQKLRKAIGEEPAEMRCAELKGTRMLDYLYGMLAADEAAAIERHLDGCDACREEAEDLKKVRGALDALEGDHKMMHIVELDAAGEVTLYVIGDSVNHSDAPVRVEGFDAEKTSELRQLIVQGEEVPFERKQSERCEHRYSYTVHLPRPVMPGERLDMLCVFRRTTGQASSLGDGRWRFGSKQCCSSEDEFVFVQATRLPVGARLLSADPAADEVRTNATSTLVWRTVLAPNQQFECTIDYRL